MESNNRFLSVCLDCSVVSTVGTGAQLCQANHITGIQYMFLE